MEDSMSNKHLPRLFAQALNDKHVELFDVFIHPEYNNHNAYVEPGPAGVKAFFRHYLDAFPDTKVVMEDVIESGDRISARFTYNGTFSKPFMGYQPNSAAIEMRSIDIWRVKDGTFIEHWDELNLLEVFQQRRSDGEKAGETMNYLIWTVSLIGILSTAVVCGTDMFFLTVGRPALRLASPSVGTEVMGFIHLFGDARMPVWGISAIFVELRACPVQREWTSRVLFRPSLSMLILFVVIYNRLSKPINRLQTEAAKTGGRLDNARELQASWDRSVMIRAPLLVASLRS